MMFTPASCRRYLQPPPPGRPPLLCLTRWFKYSSANVYALSIARPACNPTCTSKMRLARLAYCACLYIQAVQLLGEGEEGQGPARSAWQRGFIIMWACSCCGHAQYVHNPQNEQPVGMSTKHVASPLLLRLPPSNQHARLPLPDCQLDNPSKLKRYTRQLRGCLEEMEFLTAPLGGHRRVYEEHYRSRLGEYEVWG